jgi:hypothetical protein
MSPFNPRIRIDVAAVIYCRHLFLLLNTSSTLLDWNVSIRSTHAAVLRNCTGKDAAHFEMLSRMLAIWKLSSIYPSAMTILSVINLQSAGESTPDFGRAPIIPISYLISAAIAVRRRSRSSLDLAINSRAAVGQLTKSFRTPPDSTPTASIRKPRPPPFASSD